MSEKPYGICSDGTARCINAEPGTFNHECGKPAEWIGTMANGFRSCFCSSCKSRGSEARAVQHWEHIDG